MTDLIRDGFILRTDVVPEAEPYVQPCMLCDPYQTRLTLWHRDELILCYEHSIARDNAPIVVRRGLPFGFEPSWKRGIWA